MPEQTLAQRIRTKYPGTYDDIDDAELEQRVIAKYPGTYDDIPRTKQATTTTTETPRHPLAQFGDLATSVGSGLLKQVGERAVDVSQLAEKIPGVSALSEAMGTEKPDYERARELLKPTSTAESIGKGAGQVAEVLIPGRAITATGQKLASALAPRLAPVVGKTMAQVAPRAAVEAAGSAGIATAQGGDPSTAAAIGAATPIPGAALAKLAPRFRQAAHKQTVQALGPTKERFKAMAEKRAPDVLKRGIRGSREGVQQQARLKVQALGNDIDNILSVRGAQRTDPAAIIDKLEESKAAFRTTREVPLGEAVRSGMDLAQPGTQITGQTVKIPINFEPRAIEQIDDLQQTLRSLGPDARIDQLVAIRRAWDKVVSQAGGFQQRAKGALGIPLKEQSEAFAKREATKAIRKHLEAEVPDLAAVNKEFAFWKDLDDIVTQTIKRTQPQGKGLGRITRATGGGIVGGLAGAGVGGPVGGGIGAVAGGAIADQLQAIVTSPRWRLVSAGMKDSLASALASGNAQAITRAVSRLAATQGARVPSSLAPAPAGSR